MPTTLRCATIGFRGRGNSHIGSIKGMQQREQGVKLTALCDVDKKVLEAGAAKHKVAGYQDIRVMLETEELDVVMWPPRTTGTASPPSGLSRPARMFTWRSP